MISVNGARLPKRADVVVKLRSKALRRINLKDAQDRQRFDLIKNLGIYLKGKHCMHYIHHDIPDVGVSHDA